CLPSENASLPVHTSQIVILPFVPAEASQLPSAEKAMASIELNSSSSLPSAKLMSVSNRFGSTVTNRRVWSQVDASQIARLPEKTIAKRRPSGDIATVMGLSTP